MRLVCADQVSAIILIADTSLSFYITGYGPLSRFDLKVARKDKSLLKSVVTYIGASSEFTGSSFIRHCHGQVLIFLT
jgi:hypothetical protein